jgi:hypothetical protein
MLYAAIEGVRFKIAAAIAWPGMRKSTLSSQYFPVKYESD